MVSGLSSKMNFNRSLSEQTLQFPNFYCIQFSVVWITYTLDKFLKKTWSKITINEVIFTMLMSYDEMLRNDALIPSHLILQFV